MCIFTESDNISLLILILDINEGFRKLMKRFTTIFAQLVCKIFHICINNYHVEPGQYIDGEPLGNIRYSNLGCACGVMCDLEIGNRIGEF